MATKTIKGGGKVTINNGDTIKFTNIYSFKTKTFDLALKTLSQDEKITIDVSNIGYHAKELQDQLIKLDLDDNVKLVGIEHESLKVAGYEGW